MTIINIRTDEKLKKEANIVLQEMGLDMSSGIKLFLTQVVLTKTIPFKVRTANGFTIEEEERILKDIKKAEKEIKAGKRKLYSSAEEMIKDLLK